MYDYNAALSAVDETMTLLEHYRAELSDVRAAAAFALADVQEAVRREVFRCTEALDALREKDDDPNPSPARHLRGKLEALEDLQSRCVHIGTQLLDEWNSRCAECDRLASDGRGEAGRYLQKLGGVVHLFPANTAPGTVHTIILDSARYPQTAEHVRIAQNRGHPDILTLGRSGAEERRRVSLAEKPRRSIYDRDEYPCAMFAEGGEGADVAYIEGRDNRGSGSALQWQLRTLPDGSRVRIRII